MPLTTQSGRNMSCPYGFDLRAFGCQIRAEAESPEACAILDGYIFPSLARTAAGASPDIVIRIADSADQFQLIVDDTVVTSASSPLSLVPHIIRAVDETVIQRLTTLRAVHAGAVLLSDRVLLLPGATHAGKSSLVAELLRRGATYFSDEYALIDSEGRVHPYPRPLLLRNGSPEQIPVLPAECNAPVGDVRATIGWILAVRYMPDSPWSVSPISQSEALLIMLKNTPHPLAESPEMLEYFQRAVAGTTGYVGSQANAAHAADQILGLVAQPR
jgi:hypothetical protein